MDFDITIIGAGIVGLATAHKLLGIKPDLKIAVLDKEPEVAVHQTGHNSGVIHSGIYYKPGSLKALNCQRGYKELITFCRKHNVEFDLCGKLIVAVTENEKSRLDKILRTGIANGMSGLLKISAAEAREREPHVNCVEAIYVPQAGIVSYKEVALKYAELIRKANGQILLNRKVENIRQSGKIQIVETNEGSVSSKFIVNCAGLYADKIARMTMPDLKIKVLPFRGEYYTLKKEWQHLVKHLIYPVPNPDFPFLGVHFTRMIKGGIEAGPNAVLAFKREGYSRWDFNASELAEVLAFPGFRKLARKYWRDGMGELHRSYSKNAFVKILQKLIPDIRAEHLGRGGAGVRAMACHPNGNLVDDYLMLEADNILQVLNAPSPAATSSLSIGQTVAEKILAKAVF